MRPSAFLRTLRFPVKLPSSHVSPLPVRTAFDGWLGTELAGLRCSGQQSYTSTAWIVHALDVAIAAQKTAIESVAGVGGCGHRAAIDACLEDVVQLLDACNVLRERMEAVRKYVESLGVAAHHLSHTNESAFERAKAVLRTCGAMEGRCLELDRCSSSLRKLGKKLAQRGGDVGADVSELEEALSGSKAMALLVCGMLSTALSFKSKRGLSMSQCRQSGSWSSALHELHKEAKEETDKRRKHGGVVLDEFQEVVEIAKKLRRLISKRPQNEMGKREMRTRVGELERSCGELEGGIKMFEAKFNQLYKEMISIRMALLGYVSAL